MNSFLKYAVLRTLLLVLTYAIVWGLLRLRWDLEIIDPFVLVGAIVLSAVISVFALRRLREEVSRKFEQRAANRAARLELSRESDELD